MRRLLLVAVALGAAAYFTHRAERAINACQRATVDAHSAAVDATASADGADRSRADIERAYDETLKAAEAIVENQARLSELLAQTEVGVQALEASHAAFEAAVHSEIGARSGVVVDMAESGGRP